MSRRANGQGSGLWMVVALALCLAGLGASGLSGAAGCSIDRRSDAFACEVPADCETGRTCVDQLCVVPQDAGNDCPAGCTRCEGGTCYVDCTAKDCDNFTCPTGFKCNITCGSGRCSNLDCDKSDCDVLCEGTNACQDVDCGTGRCNITCSGRRSCTELVCDDACGCQVTCDGLVACTDVTCPTGCNEGNGCSSTAAAACNTCR